MIFFCDVNTIWRRRFGAALALLRPDIRLVAPYGALPGSAKPDAGEGELVIRMLPGWASRLAPIAMPLLARKLRSIAARDGEKVNGLVLTSFHYLQLAEALPDARVVYYCSDDYRSYRGWGGGESVDKERRLCRRAAMSVFVSETLRERAVAEYGLDRARTAVLPNATEPRFADPAIVPPPELDRLARPIFGTVGVFNDRIDFAFLLRLVEEPSVGSLALIGPVEPACQDIEAFKALAAHPKVRLFGAQPHQEIHRWMKGLDVGVIPYSAHPLNHFCSPMRLYDHLAIGQPVLASPNCDQINRRSDVLIAAPDNPAAQAARAAELSVARPRSHFESWEDRARGLKDLL